MSTETQSFLLRFWYERSRIGAGHWRGSLRHLRHSKQAPSDNPRSFVDPEDGFALVRHALARATPDAATAPPQGVGPINGSDGPTASIDGWWALAVRAMRRILRRAHE